mgnify:CR=1 FL=1
MVLLLFLTGPLILADTAQNPEGSKDQTTTTEQSTDEDITFSGGEIIVSAPRIDIPLDENPSATTVVNRAVLDTMPRTVGAEEALALVPGVKVDNQANGERVHLSIRGQGILTERGVRGIKVLLDGIPLNDPTGFAPDLFDVDWATVDKIEVLRGPASALYGGGGSGGILNIETADGGPDPISGDTQYTMGSNGFMKTLAVVGGTEGGVNYRFSASRTQGDGFRVHTAFHATNLYGKIRFADTKRLHLTAIVSGTSFFNENAEGLNINQVNKDPEQPNPDALLFNEFQRTRRGTGGFVGQIDLVEGQNLSFAAYLRNTRWKESVPSSVQHRAYEGMGGYLQYNLAFDFGSFGNRVSIGYDYDQQDIDDYRRPNLGRAEEGTEILSDETIHQENDGIFFSDTLDLGKGWTLVAGVRHDKINNRLNDNLATEEADLSKEIDYSETTARAGLAWSVTPTFGLYASWGEGFLPPATEEIANNPENLGGFNESLEPATSRSVEVGTRGTLGSEFSYDIAVFRLLTDNDFGRYRISDRPLETFYRNAGFSRRYGLETLFAWFPVDAFTARLAYTYSDFTYDKVEIGDEVYRDTRLPNCPRHMAYLDMEVRPLPHLSFGLGVQSLSRAYIDGTNSTWISGYSLVNARISYLVNLGPVPMELMVSGRNLLDKDYIAFTEPDPDGNSYQPGPGREVFAGVVLHL